LFFCSCAPFDIISVISCHVGTGEERERVKGFVHITLKEGTYEGKMSVPASFGPVGAVLVENQHHEEMFIKDIKLITGGDESTAVTFDVGSWVHSKFDNPEPRVFFTIRVTELGTCSYNMLSPWMHGHLTMQGRML
jgi:hypothetical protein